MGQQFDSAQGSISSALTVALIGSAVACAAGLVSPNNEGTVPLIGSEIVSAQETITPTLSLALTGSETASSSGTLTPSHRGDTFEGQGLISSAGDVTPSGSGVTAHLSGSEISLSTGTIGTSQNVAGDVFTSAAGSVAYELSVALTGLESACGTGSVSGGQDADDSLITSSIGSVAGAFAVELAGSSVSCSQGSVVVTSDAFEALTGDETVTEAGSVGIDKSFALVGEGFTSAQYNVGAPGGAALSGAEITASAGNVFLDGDRTLAISGAEITASAGDTFASPLAFVDGQALVSELQGIGPRTVELSGIESVASAGELVILRERGRGGGKPDKPKRNYIYKGIRYQNITDDELAAIIARDIVNIGREDISVSFKGKKPHKIGKEAFEKVVEKASTIPVDTDDEDIEAIMSLL